MTRPVQGTSQEQISAILSNICEFDKVKFATWLMTKPGPLRRIASRVPPDRLYRCHVGPHTTLPLYGYIEGYTNEGDVVVVTVPNSAKFTLPAAALEDVTDDAQAERLKLV